MAKIDPYCMKRRKNYFLENRKNFHLEKFLDLKNFPKILKKFKILKENWNFWQKFQITADLIWLCSLIWLLSDLNLTLRYLEVGEHSIFSYFWCPIWTVKPLKTIPMTPQTTETG